MYIQILISIFKVVQFRSIYSLYVNSILNRFGIDLMLCGVATVFLFSFLARIRFNFALSRKIRKERRKEKSDDGGAVASLEKIYAGFRKLHRNDRAMLALPRV